MRRILTIDQGEGTRAVEREIAGLLTEAAEGDEIVVEDDELVKLVVAQLGQGSCSPIKVTLDRAAVEEERTRIRHENADQVTKRLVGAERNSPRVIDAHFGVPGPVPGSRVFTDVQRPPPPDHVHHPVAGDVDGE